MESNHYQNIVKNSSFGYAYHKIVLDAKGKPIDFEFIEVNQAFEKITNLESSKVLNRKVTEIFPDIKKNNFGWISFCGDIALNGGKKEFEQYSEKLKRWYKGEVCSYEKYYFTIYFEDISEQKQTLNSVLEDKTLLSILLDAIPVPLFYKNRQGVYMGFNRAYEGFFGMTRDKLIGMSVFDISPEDLARVYFDKDNELFEHPGTQIYEDMVKDVKGVLHDVVLHKTTMTDATGEIIGLVGVLLDITELKKAIEAIKESEDKFSKAFKNSPDIMIITSIENGKIIEVNDSILRISGYTRDESIGKSTIELNHWENDNDRNKFLEEVQNTGRVKNFEANFRKKSGEIFTGLISGEIIYLKELKCVLSVIHDITERKQAEESLQKSEQRLKALIDAIPDMMLRLNKEGVYLDYKPSEKEDLYYQFESIIGKRNRDITPPEFADMIDEKIYKTITTREIQAFEYRLPVNPKDLSTYEARMVPSGNDEVIAIIRDITERKRAEEQLKESEARLRELNATKDKFFNIIAHDLKNPFNAIVGFSDILAEQIRMKDYEKIEKYADVIHASALRAVSLLKNLLDWSRSQTGRIEFTPDYVEMVGLVNEVIKLLSDSAIQKSITITRELPHNAPVIADKDMIATILRNLISNAVKFTNPGGEIVVSVIQKSSELQISVCDDGVGMSKEIIERLFRIDKSISTNGTLNETGTGLGLILSKEFIEKHRGKIWVESEPGKGSKFIFTIPNNQ